MAARRRAVVASMQQLVLGKPTVTTHSSSTAFAAARDWSGRKRPCTAIIAEGCPRITKGGWLQHPCNNWAGSLRAANAWKASREMSCCAGLGSPPPREIMVEYGSTGGEDDYTDEFIKLANAIEEAYPEFVVSGNPDIVSPRKGAFEITVGDTILFSKLKMNRLPNLHEVLRAIDALPAPQCTFS